MNCIEITMKSIVLVVASLCVMGQIEAARSPAVSRVRMPLPGLRGERVVPQHPYLDKLDRQLREQGLLDRAAAAAVETVEGAFMFLWRAVASESASFAADGAKEYGRWKKNLEDMFLWDVSSPACVSSGSLTGQAAVARLMLADVSAEPIGASICTFYNNFAFPVCETSKDEVVKHALAVLKCFVSVVDSEFVEPVAAAYKPVVVAKSVRAGTTLEHLFGEVSCEPEKACEDAAWFQEDLPPYNVEEDTSRPGSCASFDARWRDRPCAPTPEVRPSSAEPVRSRLCSSAVMAVGGSLPRPPVFVDRVACKAPVAIHVLPLALKVPVFDRDAFIAFMTSLGDASRLAGERLKSKKRATELRPPVGPKDREPAIKRRR